MLTPILTWSIIVGLLSLLAILRIGLSIRRWPHLFEIGSENEVIFVPGDPLPKNDEDYDDA